MDKPQKKAAISLFLVVFPAKRGIVRKLFQTGFNVMAKLSLFGALSNLQILLFTALRGKKIGTDSFGNIYYTGKPRAGDRFAGKPRERRWVIYKNTSEASTVPAEWHGWLHHQTDAIPGNDNPLRQPWQKPHLPNQTGGTAAYLPPGHATKGGSRDAATGDYQAWQPPQ